MYNIKNENCLTFPDVFRLCRVTDVKTVDEFLNRYYRSDKLIGRGGGIYKRVIFETCKRDLVEFGITWISKHNSTTGQVVAFTGSNEE